ncbi:MAG TPA: hypothetical protein VIN61_18660 [Gammaproteobacteria bacterium]
MERPCPVVGCLLTSLTLAGGCGAQSEGGLDSLSDLQRDTFFLEAIRGDGFICAAVMTTQRITDDGRSWRVSCTDPAAYLVTVEDGRAVEVTPTPYTEPLPVPDRNPRSLPPPD